MATEARETAGLIGSDKVEGTYVYDAHGQHIGSIERVMIDKRSGQVAYAVLSFGGFLGIGSDYYPLPWESLTYDTSLGGYRTTLTEQQLKGAPKYTGSNWDWDDRARGRKVYDYRSICDSRWVSRLAHRCSRTGLESFPSPGSSAMRPLSWVPFRGL
jgi:hypothetical protein